jgi:hypothetical protein
MSVIPQKPRTYGRKSTVVRPVGGRRSSYSHCAWTHAGRPRASKVVPNSPSARRTLRRRARACVREDPPGQTGGRRSAAAARSENGSGRGTGGKWTCARCPGRVGGTYRAIFEARSERTVQCKRTNHEPRAGSPETWCTHLIVQKITHKQPSHVILKPCMKRSDVMQGDNDCAAVVERAQLLNGSSPARAVIAASSALTSVKWVKESVIRAVITDTPSGRSAKAGNAVGHSLPLRRP